MAQSPKRSKSKRKRLRIIKNTILYVVLALVLLMAFVFAVKPNQSKATLGYWFIEVYSENMGDAVPVNSMAVAKELLPDQYQIGDVIAYPYGGTSEYIVISRVINVEEVEGRLYFTTQGDMMDLPEPVIASEYVRGRVERYIGGLGIFSAYVKANRWMIFAVVLLAEGLILFLNYRKEQERKARARKRAAQRKAAQRQAAVGNQ